MSWWGAACAWAEESKHTDALLLSMGGHKHRLVLQFSTLDWIYGETIKQWLLHGWPGQRHWRLPRGT